MTKFLDKIREDRCTMHTISKRIKQRVSERLGKTQSLQAVNRRKNVTKKSCW